MLQPLSVRTLKYLQISIRVELLQWIGQARNSSRCVLVSKPMLGRGVLHTWLQQQGWSDVRLYNFPESNLFLIATTSSVVAVKYKKIVPYFFQSFAEQNIEHQATFLILKELESRQLNSKSYHSCKLALSVYSDNISLSKTFVSEKSNKA